jgi:pyruvate ferredoxin oxidoreductase beta subunit
MIAHGIDYVATASAAYPLDLYDKIKQAISLKGVKYIHIHTPCPPGWGYDARYTVKIGELAVETGYWDLYEVAKGEFRLTGASAKTLKKGARKPVEEYLRAQSRFRVMSPEQAAGVQAQVDAKWSTYSSGGNR